jgi:hypothetical protein
MNINWGQIGAMERSHSWQVFRGHPPTRSCRMCGDMLDSAIRYCPGVEGIDTQVMVSSSGIVANDPLFPWPPDGGLR